MRRIPIFVLFVLVTSFLQAQMKYFAFTDSLVYHYGDSIHVTVGVTNIGSVSDTLWLSDCDRQYVIDTTSEYGHFGHGPCPLTQSPYVLSPGDSLEWDYIPPYPVTQTDLSVGEHSVVGKIVGYGSSDTLWITVSPLTSVIENTALLKGYTLENSYPDPFNPSTTIEYRLPVRSFVVLSIYDALGRTVATLVNEQQNAGKYSVRFNAGELSSGTYFYHLQAGQFEETKKLIFSK